MWFNSMNVKRQVLDINVVNTKVAIGFQLCLCDKYAAKWNMSLDSVKTGRSSLDIAAIYYLCTDLIPVKLKNGRDRDRPLSDRIWHLKKDIFTKAWLCLFRPTDYNVTPTILHHVLGMFTLKECNITVSIINVILTQWRLQIRF